MALFPQMERVFWFDGELKRRRYPNAAGGFISRELDSLGEKLFAAARDLGLDRITAARAFSAAWSGYTPAHEEAFRQTAWALLKRRLIAFTYRSPRTDEITQRTAEPHHLQHYMASWVLIAWCRHRRAWRKFYLARMTELAILEQVFAPRPEDQWRPLLDSVFGLFQGSEPTSVTLRFCPFRARWIRQQHWHPDQILAEQPDGCLDLTLPVADFREIKMRILQFGADCEVLAPAALRDEIQAEIDRMMKVYQRKA